MSERPHGEARWRTADGTEVRYVFTPEDRLWLARALWGEGGDPEAVAWTMLQRWALLYPDNPGRLQSFADLLQAYNQSISRLWLEDGAKCRPGGPFHGRAVCDQTRTARRARKRRARWGDIPQRYRAAADKFLSGASRNTVPGAVHFGARDFARRRIRDSASSRREGWQELADRRGNVHITTTRSRAWAPGFVQVRSTRLAPMDGERPTAPTPAPATRTAVRTAPRTAPQRRPEGGGAGLLIGVGLLAVGVGVAAAVGGPFRDRKRRGGARGMRWAMS